MENFPKGKDSGREAGDGYWFKEHNPSQNGCHNPVCGDGFLRPAMGAVRY
jgi:hypothetical protein